MNTFELTWEQKLLACNAFANICLRMIAPGTWITQWDAIIRVHESGYETCNGSGETPEEAVLDHWRAVTDIKPPQYLVVQGRLPDDPKHIRAARWNGFMWETVYEHKQVTEK